MIVMDPIRRDLREVCKCILTEFRSLIVDMRQYVWIGPTEGQIHEFVKRASIVRQYESAECIQTLFDTKQGYLGVTYLRPAYEELLWMEYLKQIGDIRARTLLLLLSRQELYDSYTAQDLFLGKKGMRDIGFTRRISDRVKFGLKENPTSLKELGRSLGWREGSLKPSTAFIARKVGRENEYKYLYQGTSRSVHFSPHELQRRVWGQHGAVNISSSTFSNYWSDFSLSWSHRILIETAIAAGFLGTSAQGREKADKTQALLRLHEDLKPIQILTASELERWEEPTLNVSRAD